MEKWYVEQCQASQINGISGRCGALWRVVWQQTFMQYEMYQMYDWDVIVRRPENVTFLNFSGCDSTTTGQ